MSPRTLRIAALRTALACVALRALVPVGCMPAAVADGWLLQLCPDGLTPAAMAVLHRGHGQPAPTGPHAHHGHHDHHGAVASAPSSPQPAAEAHTYSCPFSVFTPVADLASAAGALLPATTYGSVRTTGYRRTAPVTRIAAAFLARAPPHLV